MTKAGYEKRIRSNSVREFPLFDEMVHRRQLLVVCAEASEEEGTFTKEDIEILEFLEGVRASRTSCARFLLDSVS